MNLILIGHIATELIVFSTLTIYFQKKLKAQQGVIDVLKQELQDHDKKINILAQQLSVLTQRMTSETEQLPSPQPMLRKRIVNTDQYNQAQVIQQQQAQQQQQMMQQAQQQQQMMQQQMMQQAQQQQQQSQPQGAQLRILSQGMPMFPVEALLGSLMPQMPQMRQKQEEVVVMDDEEDSTTGIEDELASLNQNTEEKSTNVKSTV